ncbi:Hint domain-containing protein [Halomonas elongata]|uniref:Hint domain-containing protein n=1 Tax=Halomonas elongata TaxID=2746 RepID=UPI001CB93B5B|nr:Hint domain-containing protein [Halomonas elongata]
MFNCKVPGVRGLVLPVLVNQDLILTANHGVIIDGLVINAGVLVNHDTIDYLPWGEMPAAITYYHIETDTHEVVIANGTEAETYIDYVDRQAFSNYSEYVALYGIETRIVEMPRHRISSRRLVPQYLRERLGIEDIAMKSRIA